MKSKSQKVTDAFAKLFVSRLMKELNLLIVRLRNLFLIITLNFKVDEGKTCIPDSLNRLFGEAVAKHLTCNTLHGELQNTIDAFNTKIICQISVISNQGKKLHRFLPRCTARQRCKYVC